MMKAPHRRARAGLTTRAETYTARLPIGNRVSDK
jgi:hypothetical protein